ncbi:MAG: RNA polymerase sigma-70 factor (ECF subfamily) [Granulosicoccus sp.]|jgi:RNA polymerase sigma-70 factor (ECF subfamily)
MADSPNIQLLIEGCRRDNRASQLKLYEHFYSYGLSITLRYSKNREEALEILNDSFLKAFVKIDQYDSDFPFKPWLRRILINSSIDYHRKYSRLNENLEVAPTTELAAASYNFALDNLAFEDLIAVLQKLSPAYRLVFTLYVVEGFKHQEIAEKLNIAIGTSKSNLAKARIKLKSILQSSHNTHFKKEGNGKT